MPQHTTPHWTTLLVAFVMPSKASYPSDLPYLVKEIASLFEQYTSQESSESKSESARRSLAEVAQKLVIAARSPEENIFAIAQQVGLASH